MNKILVSMICAATLAGCATLPPLDKAIPIGRPSKFNADPDRYDHKVVYIRAHMATRPHWWQFFLYELPYRSDGLGCLSFDRNDWIMNNRYEIGNHFFILKGTFLKDATLNSFAGSCLHNDNGFVVDEEFVKARYGKRYPH
ncbi:hypothetical protein BH10PSE14_BH10PSE14_25180 [soil metagenome]